MSISSPLLVLLNMSYVPCVCACVCVGGWVWVPLHTFVPTPITSVCMCVHVCMCACVHVHVHVCVCAASNELGDCTCMAGYTGANGATCQSCGPGTFKAAPGPAACSSCVSGWQPVPRNPFYHNMM